MRGGSAWWCTHTHTHTHTHTQVCSSRVRGLCHAHTYTLYVFFLRERIHWRILSLSEREGKKERRKKNIFSSHAVPFLPLPHTTQVQHNTHTYIYIYSSLSAAHIRCPVHPLVVFAYLKSATAASADVPTATHALNTFITLSLSLSFISFSQLRCSTFQRLSACSICISCCSLCSL